MFNKAKINRVAVLHQLYTLRYKYIFTVYN